MCRCANVQMKEMFAISFFNLHICTLTLLRPSNNLRRAVFHRWRSNWFLFLSPE